MIKERDNTFSNEICVMKRLLVQNEVREYFWYLFFLLLSRVLKLVVIEGRQSGSESQAGCLFPEQEMDAQEGLFGLP